MTNQYNSSYEKAPMWAKFAIEQFEAQNNHTSYMATNTHDWVSGPKGSIVLDKRTNTLSGVRPGGFRVHEGSEISFDAILGIIRSVMR